MAQHPAHPQFSWALTIAMLLTGCHGEDKGSSPGPATSWQKDLSICTQQYGLVVTNQPPRV